ncbi:MAG: universal stress protein [Actinomycetes bacterium]
MTASGGRSAAVGDEQEPVGPRVVVGIDCSTGARAALLFALHDAARRGVPVEAIVVYRPPDYWMEYSAVSTYRPEKARAAALDHGRAFVDRVLPDGPQPPPEVRIRAVMGIAADALIGASHGADLLVVGSRGLGGFASVLLGSVSMQCALHASCPVTVVHSPEAQRERLRRRRDRAHSGGPRERAPAG